MPQPPRTKDTPLTLKQQRFVDAYDGNAKAAAVIAGISESYAKKLMMDCTKLDSEPAALAVQTAIRNRELKRLTPLIATREDRQKFWTKVYQDESQDMKDRLKAAELLGKSEADFTDNHNYRGVVRVLAPVIEG